MGSVFALIDCNNFFVSCERLFRPELEGKPVVVLSSNDGCVIARSNEAKDLGIPMAAPAFKWREAFKQHRITTFSANFEIYGDISKRITSLLTTITPRIEIYSVDESFLDLSSLPITDYAAWGRAVRETIGRYIGVPVSIGIAPSKTLAKLVSERAKQHVAHRGVVSLVGEGAKPAATALTETAIEDVWGIGWKLAPKMRAEGISTALQLSQMRPQYAEQLMGVLGRKLVSELNGISCNPLEQEHAIAKSILRSRTFGEDTNQIHVLESAIATMSAQAAFRLRREGLLARHVGFFANTNLHKPGYRRWAREVTPSQPTNDTGLIISLLTEQLAEVFSNKQQYHRLGVYVHGLVPEAALQTDLLGDVKTTTHDRAQARMQALDTINSKHGKGKLYYAAEALNRSWQPKQQIRSPRYVSSWAELPEARLR